MYSTRILLKAHRLHRNFNLFLSEKKEERKEKEKVKRKKKKKKCTTFRGFVKFVESFIWYEV